MAGNTGHHLAGMGIQDFGPDRMGEFALVFMALDTDIVAIAPEHGQVGSSVGFMTLAAFLDWWMLGLALLVAGQGFLMAGRTEQPFRTFEQGLVIAGMGRMTVKAGVAFMQGQVTVGGVHLALDIFMTGQAGRHGIAARRVVAGGAAILEGFVQDIANQSRPVAAMGIVTGKTVGDFARIVLVVPGQAGRFVTGKTQVIWFLA